MNWWCGLHHPGWGAVAWAYSVYSRRTFGTQPMLRPVREVQVKVEFLVADGDLGSARSTRLSPSDKKSCKADLRTSLVSTAVQRHDQPFLVMFSLLPSSIM